MRRSLSRLAATLNKTQAPWQHVAFLTLIAAYFLIFPIYRGFFPLEIAPQEAWNAYHQDAAMSTGPLYGPPNSLFVNNYPPLSFYAIGLIASYLGDALYVGRALSVGATRGLGIIIGLSLTQLGAGRTAAAIGGAWFVATMASAFHQFVGMNEPQLLSQLMMGCALAWFLSRGARGLNIEAPILVMVIATFWKHNVIAIPVSVLGWVFLHHRRRALRPLLVAVFGLSCGLALCIAIYGDAFIANVFMARKYTPHRMLFSLGRLQSVAPALIIWAIWAWRDRVNPFAQFTALWIGVALVLHLVQWLAEGVTNNSAFDLVIASSIGLGMAYDQAAILAARSRWSTEGIRAIIMVIVAFRLIATSHIEPALIMFDPGYRQTVSQHAALARAEAERVAAIPGSVFCANNKVVCRMAGKQPVFFEDFFLEHTAILGAMKPEALPEVLKRRGITYATIDHRAEADSIRRDLLARILGGEQWN